MGRPWMAADLWERLLLRANPCNICWQRRQQHYSVLKIHSRLPYTLIGWAAPHTFVFKLHNATVTCFPILLGMFRYIQGCVCVGESIEFPCVYLFCFLTG